MRPEELLQWSAGKYFENVSLPESTDEIARAVEDISAHKLRGRFTRRLETAPEMSPSRELVRELEHQTSVDDDKLEVQLRLFEEIRAELDNDVDLVLLKGPMAYLLTGELEAARTGHDLDLLATDEHALVRVLEQLGFEEDAAMRLGAHEVGTYLRGGLEIDVHRSFPVWSLPDHGWPSGELRGDLLVMHDDIEELQIPADVISRLSTESGTVPGVRVPDAALQVIILVSHVLKDALRHVLPKPLGTIKLSELADIEFLAASPRFDRETYKALAQEYSAHSSVAFARALTHALIGPSCLEPTRDDKQFTTCGDTIPRVRGAQGLWLQVDRSFHDLLLAPGGATALVHTLGSNNIASCGSSIEWPSPRQFFRPAGGFVTFDATVRDPHMSDRFALAASIGDEDVTVYFEAELENETIRLDLAVLGDRNWTEVVCIRNADDMEIAVYGPGEVLRSTWHDGLCRVAVKVPAHQTREGTPLLATFSGQARKDADVLDIGVSVPISVRP